LKQLLAGLFKVCEIKVSGAQLKELAAIIGPGKKHVPLFNAVELFADPFR
jgi:hypothetical protein